MNPDESREAWRVAVIGGGMSGLAAAHRLVRHCASSGVRAAITLFEGSPRLGGTIETQRVGEYLVESGPDSFITNKPWMQRLCADLGMEEEIVSTNPEYRRSLVLFRGQPVQVPGGFVLFGPTRLEPVLRSPLFSRWGKLRLLLEMFVPRRRDWEDESIADFARRRLGREAWERLVQPLVGGIYTADPERLSILATLPRFREMERMHGSLIRAAWEGKLGNDGADDTSGARYGLFASLAGGLSTLVDRLRERIEEFAEIRLNCPVAAIRRDSEWRLVFPGGASETFDAVIVAAPAPHAAQLLRPVDTVLAGQLGKIECASTAIVVTGHALSDVEHPLDAFGLVVPHVENRKILAVSFASRKFAGRAPEGRVQLRTFVGGALQPELLDLPDDELVEMVRSELQSILGVRGREDFVLVRRYTEAMPQYHLGHRDLVRSIEERVAGLAGLELAGNAYEGVGLPDCVHSGERAADRLAAARFAAGKVNAEGELPGNVSRVD